jgi:hypothetical protein
VVVVLLVVVHKVVWEVLLNLILGLRVVNQVLKDKVVYLHKVVNQVLKDKRPLKEAGKVGHHHLNLNFN